MEKGKDSGTPLVDWAMNSLNPDPLCMPLSHEAIDAARGLIGKFVEGEISYRDAQSNARALLGSTTCIDKIFDIISLPDEPIPSPGLDGGSGRLPSNRRRTHPWTAQEDARLLAGIHRYGMDMWPAVAQFVGNGRTRSQCSQRWIRGLDPHISKEPWTKDDEEQLLKLVEKHGSRAWVKVAAEMGTRADVQCRYHFLQMIRGSTPKDKCASADSEPNLLKVPGVDLGKCVIEPSPSLPSSFATKSADLADEFLGTITWDNSTGVRKGDPLFPSDFWSF
jgi:hypothetical protein